MDPNGDSMSNLVVIKADFFHKVKGGGTRIFSILSEGGTRTFFMFVRGDQFFFTAVKGGGQEKIVIAHHK